MTSKQSMTQQVTHRAIETAKAVTMAVREAENAVNAT